MGNVHIPANDEALLEAFEQEISAEWHDWYSSDYPTPNSLRDHYQALRTELLRRLDLGWRYTTLV